eukprot:7143139-Karenia_brevis.AAC.1
MPSGHSPVPNIGGIIPPHFSWDCTLRMPCGLSPCFRMSCDLSRCFRMPCGLSPCLPGSGGREMVPMPWDTHTAHANMPYTLSLVRQGPGAQANQG